jgi:hypothetical protein
MNAQFKSRCFLGRSGIIVVHEANLTSIPHARVAPKCRDLSWNLPIILQRRLSDRSVFPYTSEFFFSPVRRGTSCRTVR